MRVLVTGGCGFIGGAVVRKLRKQGVRVDIVDDMSAGDLSKIATMPLRVVPTDLISIYQNTAEPDELEKNHVLVFEGDFAHPLLLSRIAQGFYTYVFHLAANPRVEYSVKNPLETTNNNVSKTVALLQACAGNIKRFVFSSSCAVYGDHYSSSDSATNETAPYAPESPYALHKMAIDEFLPMFYKFHNLDSVALRYFNVYGPGHDGTGAYSTAVAAWCNALKNNRKLRSDGDGTQSRDMVYVDDIANANVLAALHEDDLKGASFNICTGSAVTNNEILQMIWKAYGPYERTDAPWRPGDVMHTLGDPSAAKEAFGFECQMPFRQGLELTMKWWELV
jgi:nucleoside-diphosphate-sugar epimerase|tara:strand:+ start:2195 stop:3202 length:1008 start_codon:yes stop_codon:yes gene_type:complete